MRADGGVVPSIRIGIIGDFDPGFRSHLATTGALSDVGRALQVQVRADWVATDSLLSEGAERVLAELDGLWCAPGSPYKSKEGALKAIRFARERNVPFIGT